MQVNIPGNVAEAVVNLQAYVATDGLVIIPDSYDQALAYDGSGNLVTTTATAPDGRIYIQTLTWTGGKLTGISRWVKQ